MSKRLVYICDWLPPDFGAVGQYAMLEARQWAQEGWDVTLIGLTTGQKKKTGPEEIGPGLLTITRLHRASYQKQKFAARLLWTIRSNLTLLAGAFKDIRSADAILFTGSPPLMLHFISPMNVLLRKRLIYRIMDFHPECLIAERGRSGPLLNTLLRLTCFWRRRVDSFEVLGLDQSQRLRDIGIPEERIHLKRSPPIIDFKPSVEALPLPKELQNGSGVILYSGNFGVAHDDATFLEAYSQYYKLSSKPLLFWLNATGVKADRIEREFRSRGVPVYRSNLVPLDSLPRLLRTPSVHLVTLRDSFVGYVLPSKIYACIESGRKVLFVGSRRSDVHLLASGALKQNQYHQVDVGNVNGLIEVLHSIETDLSNSSTAILDVLAASQTGVVPATHSTRTVRHA